MYDTHTHTVAHRSRHTRRIAALLVVIAIAMTAIVTASTGAAAGHATIAAARTMTLYGTALELPHDGIVDVGARGHSVGDEMLIADTLRNRAHARVGIDRGTCTVIHVSEPITNKSTGENSCVGTMALADGTLTFQAIEYFTKSAVDAAVTGGTGRYLGASGEAHIVFGGGGASSTWTIRLVN